MTTDLPTPAGWPPIPVVTLPKGWTPAGGQLPALATHDMRSSALFSDTALIDLLDRMPRAGLIARSTGGDLLRPQPSCYAQTDGVSGADLLRAVRSGRLWLDITRVDLVDRRYRWLIDQLYAGLATALPGFSPRSCQGNLLISSPNAQVEYHADASESLLWQLRGRKRIWVYPALDPLFVAREALEDIYAQARHEYLPFDPAFDAAAASFELGPGDFASWAHNAPHRVSNLDCLNVSLATEHYTPAGRRRARLYRANRYLRTQFGASARSALETGPAALLKVSLHRLARLCGSDRVPPMQFVPALRVDADAPGGVTALAAPSAPDRVRS